MFELAEILPCQSSTTSHSHHCRCILAVCKDHPGYDKHISKCRTSYLNSRIIILLFIPGSGIDQVHGGSDEPANCAGVSRSCDISFFPPYYHHVRQGPTSCRAMPPQDPTLQRRQCLPCCYLLSLLVFRKHNTRVFILILGPMDLRISISLRYSPDWLPPLDALNNVKAVIFSCMQSYNGCIYALH